MVTLARIALRLIEDALRWVVCCPVLIRTSVDATRMDSADCVRNYKALANVERAFRSLKTVDLKVRLIHHCTADRVRAHIAPERMFV
jgi:transposase